MRAALGLVALAVIAGCGSASHAGGSTAAQRSPRLQGQTLTMGRDRLVGAYFAPRRARARGPAVVMIGGSNGDAPVEAAGELARLGYPTLALWYFDAPGLPRTLGHVPLEYFARALRWIAARPGVDPRRVVIDGGSRGGEAALLVASTYPRLVHGAIAIVPNYQTGYGSDGGSGWTLHGRRIPSDRPIRVEQISGPVLAVGTRDDPVWSSGVYVEQIRLRLGDHHFRFPHREIVTAHGGHRPPVTWPATLRYLRALT